VGEDDQDSFASQEKGDKQNHLRFAAGYQVYVSASEESFEAARQRIVPGPVLDAKIIDEQASKVTLPIDVPFAHGTMLSNTQLLRELRFGGLLGAIFHGRRARAAASSPLCSGQSTHAGLVLVDGTMSSPVRNAG